MKIIRNIINILSRYGWAATLIILGGFAAGFTWSSSDDLYSNIRLFDKTAITVTSEYVENIDEIELIKAGIDGMLSKLDQYSKFLSGADYEYLRQETEGEFEGIGVTLGFHHDTLTVESVLEGTPSYSRGVKSGDKILKIDSMSTINLKMRKIKLMLRGPRGSTVNLRLYRPPDGIFELTVERDKIGIKAVVYSGMASADIGYIRLARFSEGCSKELRTAIKDLKRQGMQSLILDLRDNPGGLLLESVRIAGFFLPERAKIVETRGKNAQVGDIYYSTGEPDFQSGGLVILVDSQTASAAEIVAGAIQDHDRGIIAGCPTYGKGLVQQVMQFSDESALKLTTAKYYLPSGRCLQKPDWSSFELVKGQPETPTDSLYQTDFGRPVFGGGGIIPDIYIEGEAVAKFVEALQRESCFFDFALEYVKKHSIQPEFRADDDVMTEFRQFLITKNFSYQSEQRLAYRELREKLAEPNKRLISALATIDDELTAHDNWEFDSHYSEISEELRESIVLNAFGENILYKNIWLKSQPEILKAINILTDSGRYTDILSIH